MKPEGPADTGWKLSLVLLFLGGATLMAALVIGVQVAAARGQLMEVEAPLFALTIWGAGAVWLAFRVRRGAASDAVYFMAIGWLALGVLAAFAIRLADA